MGELRVRNVTLCFLMFFAVILIMAPSARATIIDGTSCDTGMMDIINKRAHMEGKREMEAAQSIILKPDSVLEYTCFVAWNRLVSGGANYVENIANKYINNNFGHSYAGGNGPTIGSGCSVMESVWRYLQCNHFDKDSFVSLNDIATTDLRSLPVNCSANDPDRTSDWNSDIAAVNAAPADIMASVANYLPPVTDFFNPDKCTDFLPIDTGLFVEVKSPDGPTKILRPDRICAAPGCYYQYDKSNPVDGSCLSEPPISTP